jgi:hypothetical protein
MYVIKSHNNQWKLGRCKLQWFKNNKSPSPKSPYKWKNNNYNGKKCLKLMLNGPYVVINQLIKSIWKATHLENSLSYMLGEKNINPTKNDQDWDFWK